MEIYVSPKESKSTINYNWIPIYYISFDCFVFTCFDFVFLLQNLKDIIFEGVDAPYVANYYKNTLTCYSFSKSISLPGERIGYLAVHPDCIEANKIIEICPQISRTIGQNGAASLMQRTVADVCNYTSDLSVYETNKKNEIMLTASLVMTKLYDDNIQEVIDDYSYKYSSNGLSIVSNGWPFNFLLNI